MKTILFLLLVIFNFLDVYQTYLLFNCGFIEWNPVMNYILINFGFLGAIFFKLFVLLFFGCVIVVHHKTRKEKMYA